MASDGLFVTEAAAVNSSPLYSIIPLVYDEQQCRRVVRSWTFLRMEFKIQIYNVIAVGCWLTYYSQWYC